MLMLMLLLLPGTGRTAHALSWGHGRERQSDTASEATVAPPKMRAEEGKVAVRERKKEK
jgi:hypothetical protein